MIDVTNHKDPVRVMRNACEPGANPKGTRIAYFYGDYADDVSRTALGKAAWELYQQGKVDLFQKLLTKEPRLYQYLAVVK